MTFMTSEMLASSSKSKVIVKVAATQLSHFFVYSVNA